MIPRTGRVDHKIVLSFDWSHKLPTDDDSLILSVEVVFYHPQMVGEMLEWNVTDNKSTMNEVLNISRINRIKMIGGR